MLVAVPKPTAADHERLREVTFDDFRRMARDDSLSRYEKIGFTDSLRKEVEEAILEDIVSKLPALGERGKRVLDIGPGCSDLPHLLIDLCARRGHEAVFVDSSEMLEQLPDPPHLTKVPGAFPAVQLPPGSDRAFDAILAYSVIQYVHAEADVSRFLDRALELLAHGGRLLIGDVPNASKRARFLSSPAGVAFHKRFMQTDEPPDLSAIQRRDRGQIDDDLVLGLLARARAAGFDAYALPLRPDLPLANRREDVLVARP